MYSFSGCLPGTRHCRGGEQGASILPGRQLATRNDTSAEKLISDGAKCSEEVKPGVSWSDGKGGLSWSEPGPDGREWHTQ